MSDEHNYPKVLLIFQTCIVKRFVENTFQGSQYAPTPGVDFMSRRLTVKPIGSVTLIIADIGGAALTSKMIDIYLHGVDVSDLSSSCVILIRVVLFPGDHNSQV